MRYEVDVREIRVLDLDVYTSCQGVCFFLEGNSVFVFFLCWCWSM